MTRIFHLLFISMPFIFGAGALKLLSNPRGPGSFVFPETEVDLPSLLHVPPHHQSDIYSNALQLLNSMKMSPSCNRLAATNLILSCQSLDNSDDQRGTGFAESLDNIKSLFAARLAVCELVGAGTISPNQCSRIFPSQPPDKRSHLTNGKPQRQEEEDAIRESRLEPCLRSLESRPQWWTSYSNARQNAAVMCQAARIEIDREEQIQRYENLANIAFSLTNVLNQSMTNAAGESSNHRSFLKKFDTIRQNLIRDLEQAAIYSRDIFTDLFGNVELLHSSVTGVELEVKNLGKEVLLSEDALHLLRKNMSDIYAMVLNKSSASADLESKNHQKNVELAVAVQRSIESMKDRHTMIMAQEFATVHSALEAVNDLATSMHKKHVFLDERLEVIDNAFREFELRSGALQQLQLQQMQNHSRLQESFQTDLRIAQALLKDITASAANLQSSIEATHTLFSRISTISDVIGSFSWWVWTAITFCILLLLSPRLAAASFIISVATRGMLSADVVGLFSRIIDSSQTEGYIEITFFALGLIAGIALVIKCVRQSTFPVFKQYFTQRHRWSFGRGSTGLV